MLTAQPCWLDNVSGVSGAHFSLPLIGQQDLGHFRQRPLLPIGWKILQTVQWKNKGAPKYLKIISDPYFGQDLSIHVHNRKIHPETS